VQQQCILDNDVQWIGRCSLLLLMEQRHVQFHIHTSGLAVFVFLRCKQRTSEHPAGKSLMVLGQVILIDTPHSPFSNSI
jgi:hypothetical protein